MNEIWLIIEPYVTAILSALATGGLGAVLMRGMTSGWFRKHDYKSIATDVARQITSSKINLDLTAITEKKLDKIKGEISGDMLSLQETLQAILQSQADIISVITKSTKLGKETTAKLHSDLDAIRGLTAPREELDELIVEFDTTAAESEGQAEKTKQNTLSFE